MTTELSIDPAFVRILIAKAQAAVIDVPEAFQDDPPAGEAADPLAAGEIGEEPVTERLHEEVERDETETEVAELIEDLDVDQKAELVALAWVGRGDYEPERFDEAVADARDRGETPTSDDLLEMPLLPSYLAMGLEAVTGAASTAADV